MAEPDSSRQLPSQAAPPAGGGPSSGAVPPSGVVSPSATATASADDAELGTAEEVVDQHDPRALAAAQVPQNASDIVAQHTAPTASQGAPDQSDVSYGSGALAGVVKRAGGANPLTGQRELDAAAKPEAEKDAEKTDLTKKPGAKPPQAKGAPAPAPEKPGRLAQLASSPLANALVDEGARALGKAADQAAQVAADRYAPGVYKTAKNSKAGGKGLDRLQQTRLGQMLPAAFWDGFRGDKKKDQKKGKDGKEKASGPGEGSGGGRGKLKVLLAVALPVLIPGLCILLILALILGVEVSGDNKRNQPEEASDAKVAKYFPGGWQKLLKKTAEKAESSGAEDYATVPWTVLAGIVAAQTDFARYSPYDNVDRDPGRKAAPIPGGDGGGEAGDNAEIVGDTDGAGPGPISGVKGSGSPASVGHGHDGPPAGDLSHQLGWFMYSLRMHESTNNYTAGKGKGGACGAYQYINSTWNNYGGYPTACDAPPSVQDRRARRDILKKWDVYGKWQQVAAAHFYPAWATSPENWDKCPAACDFNPTVWVYVDDVMKRMREISKQYPDDAGGAPVAPAGYRTGVPGFGAGIPGFGTSAGGFRTGTGGGTGTSGEPRTGGEPAVARRPGLYADGCEVDTPSPAIGGKDKQGSGPYLLSPSAAGQMKMAGADPQSPCDSSEFVARELSAAAKKVHDSPNSPEWKPDGTLKDQENARKYWSKVIESAGIFTDRSADPDAPCAIPPPDDPDKPWSVSFKIISVWRCETARMPDLFLVTSGQYDNKNKIEYTTETNRPAATEALVNEALSVSYGAGKWKTDKCDNGKDGRQGIFPMTKKEAEDAGVKDRCDVDKNIAGAAKLVLSVEKVKPKERPHDLGDFQPMIGGWQKLSIAMGADLELFSLVGPGQGFTPSAACTEVMSKFLTAIGPHATAFAKLKEPPKSETVFNDWEPKLEQAEKANGVADPGDDKACMAGSWAPGYNATLAQMAAGLAGDGADAANLNGLGNYYQARESAANKEMPAEVGDDTLVIPRLALRPMKEIGAPVAPDATEAWSRLGNTEGVTVPLSQIAIEYAWFFGGVIPPFDSAGQLTGSLQNGTGTEGGPGTVQVSVGPDGCPTNAPNNTLRQGAKEIGIHKLCVDSVAKARTPQAAKAIKWALTHLNWPYSQARRNEDGYADCSSFVSRAYRDSGAISNLYAKGSNAPVTGTFVTASWMHKISLGQAQPGDLLEPHSGHVAMQLADGYKVHTNQPGDVSKVDRGYTSVYWAGWVDGSKL